MGSSLGALVQWRLARAAEPMEVAALADCWHYRGYKRLRRLVETYGYCEGEVVETVRAVRIGQLWELSKTAWTFDWEEEWEQSEE